MKKQFGLIMVLSVLLLGIGCRQNNPNPQVADYYATVTKMAESWNNPTSVPIATATATATATANDTSTIPVEVATPTPEPTSTPEVAMAVSATTSEWKEYLDQVELETPWQKVEQTECALYYYSQINFSGHGRQWQSAGLTWCNDDYGWFTIRLDGHDSIRVRQGTVVGVGSLGYLTIMNNEVKAYDYDRRIACLHLSPDWNTGWRVVVYDCESYYLNYSGGILFEQGYEILRNIEVYR